jgi:cytochrome c-type biogenesis protein CcmE
MDPSRKRMIRFTVALGAAVLLASALIYTSFSASSEARTPSQLIHVTNAGSTYQLTGKVVPGYTQAGDTTRFRVRDRTGTVSVPVTYTGVLPDPFRAGREVVIDVRKQGSVWVG